MIILAVDPGTSESGVVLFEGRVRHSAVMPNSEVRRVIREENFDVLAIEMIASYGMAVGAEVFDTCVWIGKFEQVWDDRDHWFNHTRRHRVFRRDVKLHLCGNARAKDANIRQALIDRWGGKAAAIGTSKQPGPLYGVKSHAWAALAVAVTVADATKIKEAA